MEMKKANYSNDVILSVANRSLHHVYHKLDKYNLQARHDRDNPPHSCRPTIFSPLTNSADIIIDIVRQALRDSNQTDLIRPPGISLRRKTENIVFSKKSHKRTMKKISKK